MTPEQLQAAYEMHHLIEGLDGVDTEAHLAGLAEVARAQAEKDAQIAEGMSVVEMALAGVMAGKDVATAIRAQFGEETD